MKQFLLVDISLSPKWHLCTHQYAAYIAQQLVISSKPELGIILIDSCYVK